jgi:tetratricopeptide (TPR) repeat protein
MAPRRSILGLLLLLPLGFAAAWQLQKGIDRQLAAVHQERDDLVMRSGKLLRVLSLEYGAFLADVYWTRVVQYFGEKHFREDANLELLAPLLDLTTTLDPHLVVAYRVGALFLAEPAPLGAGRPDLAVQFLQRGIENNPEQWRILQDMGFIYYWAMRDYQKAAEAFLEGSKRPDAAEWMMAMAVKIAREGRSRATSLFLWGQIYETTTDPLIRKNAQLQMKILRAEEDRERLDELVARFVQRFNRNPQRLDELVSERLLRRIPLDPEGYPYVLGRNGKTELNPRSPLAAEERAPASPN